MPCGTGKFSRNDVLSASAFSTCWFSQEPEEVAGQMSLFVSL